MWIVHWKINEATGHGSPVPLELATLACESGNSKYGGGTHWLVEE
jgi:hypothetical protein